MLQDIVFDSRSVSFPAFPESKILIGEKTSLYALAEKLHFYRITVSAGCEGFLCFLVFDGEKQVLQIYFDDTLQEITQIKSSDINARDEAGNKSGSSLSAIIGATAICGEGEISLCESKSKATPFYVPSYAERCRIIQTKEHDIYEIPRCVKVEGFAIQRSTRNYPRKAFDFLPYQIEPEVRAAFADCNGKPSFANGFILSKDANLDGNVDYVIDYAHFKCDFEPGKYCNSGGCRKSLYLATGDGGFKRTFDQIVEDLKFVRVRGRPAIILQLHGSDCGRMGTEACRATLYWNGFEFNPAN